MPARHEYSVLVETRAPDPASPDATDDAYDTLADALTDLHGVLTSGPRAWTAQVTVDAADPSRAASRAAALLRDRARKCGLPDWPTVRVEAVREDVLAEDLHRPTLPDLVSGPEAADILNVSPQRLHQLAAEHSRFPEPAYELRTGKVWLRSAVERFAQTWERRPGRPRKTPAAKQRSTSMSTSGIADRAQRVAAGLDALAATPRSRSWQQTWVQGDGLLESMPTRPADTNQVTHALRRVAEQIRRLPQCLAEVGAVTVDPDLVDRITRLDGAAPAPDDRRLRNWLVNERWRVLERHLPHDTLALLQACGGLVVDRQWQVTYPLPAELQAEAHALAAQIREYMVTAPA